MVNIMKITYVNATIKQLAKAKAKDPVKYASTEGRTYEEILTKLKEKDSKVITPYKLYDKWGRPTHLGKNVRLFELKKIKLSKTSTLFEYLEKKAAIRLKELKKMLNKVNKGIRAMDKEF